MNKERMEEILINFLKEKNIPMCEFNGQTLVDREGFYKATIQMIDESLEEGDINGTTINEGNLNRFLEANKIGYDLFKHANEFNIEVKQNLSFATTSVTCESVYFDTENPGQKELFQKFIGLVDFFSVSSTMSPKEISVYFSVKNVWEE